MDQFLDERINFEQTAKSNFNDIFNKLNDLSTLLSNLIENQNRKEPEKDNSAAFSKKELERLERLLTQKMDQIFTARLQSLEGSLTGGFSNLRSTLYETQNRLKNLEHCVLENAEINFNDFKKKVMGAQAQDKSKSLKKSSLAQSSINVNTNTNTNKNILASSQKVINPVLFLKLLACRTYLYSR